MEQSKKRLIDRLYGGLPMTWPFVLLFAAGTAVLTAGFLILPVFHGSSFERMGVYLEAWIFFAVIIMANCKKPLESALKTFVFFLVSQPLIYLLQVPFSFMGWQLFGYYRYWLIWTVLTFPMAYVGWYITRRNWLGALILMPVLAFLAGTAYVCAAESLRQFPRLLLAALFCLGQIGGYLAAFFPTRGQKLAGLSAAFLGVLAALLLRPSVELSVVEPLPGDPSFSEAATVFVEDSSIASVQLHSAEEGLVYLSAHKYGSTSLVITDGERESRYMLEIYRDERGSPQIRMTPQP